MQLMIIYEYVMVLFLALKIFHLLFTLFLYGF